MEETNVVSPCKTESPETFNLETKVVLPNKVVLPETSRLAT